GSAPGGDGAQRTTLIIIDEPDGKDARLFVDSNGNGDVTDDPQAEWTGKAAPSDSGQTLTQYNGGASIELGTPDHPFPAHLGMYRFDKNDPNRPQLKNTLLYYADYAYEGDITLGEKTFKAMLVDRMATGDFRGKHADEKKVDADKAGKDADDDNAMPS